METGIEIHLYLFIWWKNTFVFIDLVIYFCVRLEGGTAYLYACKITVLFIGYIVLFFIYSFLIFQNQTMHFIELHKDMQKKDELSLHTALRTIQFLTIQFSSGPLLFV